MYVLQRWSSSDGLGLPQRQDIVLDGVHSLSFTFIAGNGQHLTSWPPTPPIFTMPDAVEMQLDLANIGTLRRVFALR